MVVAGALVVAAVAFGARSRREASGTRGTTARVAVVVVDGPPPQDGVLTGLWPVQSADYHEVEATVSRYDPHIRKAVTSGAEVIVLPEVAVNVGEDTRARWIEAVTTWARSLEVVIVAPFFDRDVPANTLTVVDPSGAVSTYDKQHPARGMEPPRRKRTPPGSLVATRGGPLALNTVICVDLDYGDLVEPVREAGGILVAPSNDWFGGFDRMHHRTAVWSAVLTGVATVRATGHGISSVYDGAGRVLAERSSAEGPVVLEGSKLIGAVGSPDGTFAVDLDPLSLRAPRSLRTSPSPKRRRRLCPSVLARRWAWSARSFVRAPPVR
jgi:predicted amidohydrolase